MAPGRWKSRNSAEKNWSVADNLVAKQQNQPALVSASPPPGLARLSGESVTTGCSKICRRSVALTTRPFTPLPRWPQGCPGKILRNKRGNRPNNFVLRGLDPRSTVCRTCSTAWRCKSFIHPDGGEGLAKRNGVAARRGREEAWSKPAARRTETGYEADPAGRAGREPRSPQPSRACRCGGRGPER